MEAVIVAPLLEVLFGRLTSSVAGEVQTRRDFKKETEKLRNMLPVIQGVIEEAEEQQMKDKKVRGWLVKLKEVACDADDLLDEISTLLLRRQLKEVTDGDAADLFAKLVRKLNRIPNTMELFGLRLRRIRQRTTYKLLKLNELRGKLKIKHLEYVLPYSTYEDFRKWVESTNFYSLELLWGNDDEGAAFPIWMNMSGLESLTQLNLINCRNCESLPTLGQLPVLKILNIQGMDSVVNIGVEFSGEGDRPFSSLKELTLRDFPELKTWSSVDSAEAFICLDKLIITKCPLLITMPWFPRLKYLELQKCNQLIVRSASELNTLSTLVIDFFQDLFFLPKKLLQNNSRLMSLTVTSCPKLGSVPENLANLADLKSLKIGWCDELKTLPHGLKSLTSLENLDIIECPSLICLPEEGMEGLCSLRSFSIENCPRLTSLPMGMKHLIALENLTIMFCSNLVHLPDNFHCLVELRSMTILSCPELASLPEGLQHLKKLQILELRSCPKLMELPNWVEHLVSLRSLAISNCPNIKSLPEGLGRLSALQHLSIRDCPDLEHHSEATHCIHVTKSLVLKN
ncbi:putative disease resistance protein RGA3 [Prunus yedoensis var. nudiflora]|uniref:Putative disease resistance protein RGA3 n=1 Tax=Prunus yedoensis var. nudiflora TaxID=2094558 RepID=A0A314YB45_PRUYE|nr:putative disease resistance protein RGA3 [Prunus yedoensis var. nudiflora]